ncbi:uncharacterized protein K452DRAFT_239838, partial [Aplosporella prunicola CBS 121167]
LVQPHIAFRLQFGTRSFRRSPEFDSFTRNRDIPHLIAGEPYVEIDRIWPV